MRIRVILRIVIFLFASAVIEHVYATAQAPDYLIYKGDTLAIYSNPLESFFAKEGRRDRIFDKYGYKSTACWRGYIGYWELRNDSLFLVEVRGKSTNIDLSLIFKDRETDHGIFADWVDSPITSPYGRLLLNIHDGYKSIYEFEREFFFKQGVLTEIKEYDNSKAKSSRFTEDRSLTTKFIQENINYANIINSTDEDVRVIVEVRSVTPEGKIDSVRVVRGHDPERDKEAIRVVKSIPDWEVLFRSGKQIQRLWTIPVVFKKKDE
ncbi:MAG: energy transducer TonB [Tannerellaceae bacterium]